MKKASDVGADFDHYARRWRREHHRLEVAYSGTGVEVDPTRADEVQLPGDEWGAVTPLVEVYCGLVHSYWPGSEVINVVEIGAGGGRSTAALLDVLGPQAGDYHVVDVAPVFIDVLRERIERPLTIHVVGDVDLSGLPSGHFDLCLAQSSWSHINLYDQYRYLRDLRRVLRPGGVVFVNGHFLLGTGDDWTWNRFCTRVRRIDESSDGMVHEFTSVAALAEMLTRLGYEIACIHCAGFVARRGEGVEDGRIESLDRAVTFPFNPSVRDFVSTGEAQMWSLPSAAPTAESGTRDRTLRLPRARQVAKQIRGLRPLVRRSRATWRGVGRAVRDLRA